MKTNQMRKFLAVVTVTSLTMLACHTYASGLTGNVAQQKSHVTSPAPQLSTHKINLNKAESQDIAHVINGIGEKRAQAIVKYRQVHGSFKAIDELSNVPGLGGNFVKNHYAALVKVFYVQDAAA